MSVDHKRPLLAFAVVTVACIGILFHAVRSEAFVSVLRSEASHVAAGLGLAPADHRSGQRLERTVKAVSLVDAPEAVAPVRHLAPAQPRARHAAPVALAVSTPRDHAHGRGKHAGRHGGDPEAHGAHAGRHGNDPHGHRVHLRARELSYHLGHADLRGDLAGDLSSANTRVLGHPLAARHSR